MNSEMYNVLCVSILLMTNFENILNEYDSQNQIHEHVRQCDLDKHIDKSEMIKVDMT